MGIGFGALKGMIDTFQYNRGILGKKKTLKEKHKDEIKNRLVKHQGASLEEVKLRVAHHLKRNTTYELLSRVAAGFFILVAVGFVVWLLLTVDFTWKEKGKYADKDHLYETIIYKRYQDDMDLRTYYFQGGPKAGTAFYIGELKHQNSESFYESGEQFRSALYYYDTLITEVYFHKNGDTIKNFSPARDGNVRHITVSHQSLKKRIEFDYYDGKIIGGTYQEKSIED